MTRTRNRLNLAVLLAGLVLATTPVAAQPAVHPDPTLLFYHLDEASHRRTQLNGTAGLPRVRIGDAVVICFSAPQAGWVNLWSINPDGSFGLIYPNKFSGHGGNGAKIAAGEQYCMGEDESFRLRVRGEEGRSQIYLNWVATEEALLAPEHFIDLFSQNEMQTSRTIRTHDLGRSDVYFSYTVME